MAKKRPVGRPKGEASVVINVRLPVRGLYSMRVISFTAGRNEPLNSNKNVFETKIRDISTGKRDKNRG
jgi:hypothetical protein